jgi:hypothetical protein
MNELQKATTQQAISVRSSSSRNACEALGLPMETSASWWHLFAFLHRSWFGRMWIIQETAFAPNLQVQVGLLSFNLGMLNHAAVVLTLSGLGNTMELWAKVEIAGGRLEILFDDHLNPIGQRQENIPESERNLFATFKNGSFLPHNHIT